MRAYIVDLVAEVLAGTMQPGKFPEVPEGGAIWVFALP